MENQFDVLALGEILLRLSPPGNERIVRSSTFEKRMGGAELNVVSGISLLGLRTGIISRIPAHTVGMFARNEVRYSKVSDDYLIYDRDPDARLGVYYYENGAYPRKPGVVYDRKNTSINKIFPEDFPDEIYENCRCFHTSGITTALGENCRRTAVYMMKRFKQKGAMISFDVNYRANLWSGEEARKCVEKLLPYVDIFFCSEDTARLTFHKEGTAQEMMKEFAAEYDLSVVASTRRIVHSPRRHTFGSVLYNKKEDRFYTDDPYENIEVIDRIGSGDAYVSGVLYGLLCEGGSCEKALRFGNASGAAKNTIPGDVTSLNLKEIENIIKEHENQEFHTEMER